MAKIKTPHPHRTAGAMTSDLARNTLITAYTAGHSYRQIAEQLGCTINHVRWLIRCLGLPKRPRSRCPEELRQPDGKRVDLERFEQIIARTGGTTLETFRCVSASKVDPS